MNRFLKSMAVPLVLLLHGRTAAQQMVNGDFSINRRNEAVTYDCRLLGQYSGQIMRDVLNWDYSHGTPDFPYTSAGSTQPNVIRLVDNDGLGEGIIGGYHFRAGRHYIIHIGIVRLDDADPAHFIVLATKTKLQNPNQCYPLCTPDRRASGQVPALNNYDHLQLPDPHVGDNVIRFSPTSDYQYIMMYPEHDDCPIIEAHIGYVHIAPECEDISLTTPLTDYYYAGYQNIYLGGGASPLDVTSSKYFEASGQITVSSNTDIRADRNGVVHLYIDQQTCGFLPASFGDGNPPPHGEPEGEGTAVAVGDGGVSSRKHSPAAGSAQTTVLTSGGFRIRLFPNPATDLLNVEAGTDVAEIDVTMANATGQVVLKERLRPDNKRSVQLNTRALPQGVYTVRVQAGDQLFTGKTTIIR